MTIPFLQRHDMYYNGANPESFVPLWHHFGEQLRAGHWTAMDPAGWYGGNYAADGTYALWNPVQLLDYVLVSLFDDLAAAAALVQIQFLALLGAGAYLLVREHGAARWAAAAVAVGVPRSGSPSTTRRRAGRPDSWPSPGSPGSGGRSGGTRVATCGRWCRSCSALSGSPPATRMRPSASSSCSPESPSSCSSGAPTGGSATSSSWVSVSARRPRWSSCRWSARFR